MPRGHGLLQAGNLAQFSLDEIEQFHIQQILDSSSGNKTQAAKILAIDYKTLLNKLKKYGLGI